MPSTPDNQAPIVPPTAKLASNQKIQLAKLRTTAIKPLLEVWRLRPSEGVSLGESRRACGHKRHNR